MGGRTLLILLSGVIVGSGMMFYNIAQRSTDTTANADASYSRVMAQNIAQSGANLALRKLADNLQWRDGFPHQDMFGGTLKVTCDETVYRGQACVKITSTGSYGLPSQGGATRTTVAYVATESVPGAVQAGITTNNPVLTLGSLDVDGRDHDSDGGLLPRQGVYGVWTTQTLSQGGSSKIGGTFNSIDLPPTSPAVAGSYRTNQTWPGGYPSSPEGVLGGKDKGYPEGTLKAIAQAGIAGSQYVTDGNSLKLPLKGVTYVELPSGEDWTGMDVTGTGILVVHNSALNAQMQNINSGNFKGLIIADDVIHIHASIIGALVVLSPRPSSGNCIGNGTGTVLFSRQTIGAAMMLPTALKSGSSESVVAWYE
jgi:hypothetical protein